MGERSIAGVSAARCFDAHAESNGRPLVADATVSFTHRPRLSGGPAAASGRPWGSEGPAWVDDGGEWLTRSPGCASARRQRLAGTGGVPCECERGAQGSEVVDCVCPPPRESRAHVAGVLSPASARRVRARRPSTRSTHAIPGRSDMLVTTFHVKRRTPTPLDGSTRRMPSPSRTPSDRRAMLHVKRDSRHRPETTAKHAKDRAF
jgi:hypothetical protein